MKIIRPHVSPPDVNDVHLQEVSESHTRSAIAARLPPEILLQIFLDCLDEHNEDTADSFNADWIPCLAHVCRYWREIALDYPLLWSNIIFTRRSKMLPLRMLELSRNIPINIRVKLGGRPSAYLLESIKEVLMHSARVKEISLEGAGSESSNHILASFPTTFPILERLCLKGNMSMDESLTVAFQVPPQLFSQEPLALRSLTLHHCATIFDEEIFPVHCRNLVHLDLCHVGPLRSDTLLTILDNAPCLETIFIDSITGLIPVGGFPGPREGQVIDLPNLKRLSLCDQAFAVFSLLRYLTFPPQVNITLCFSIGTFMPFPIFPLLSPHLAKTRPFQSVLLNTQDFRTRRGVRLRAWNKNIPPTFFYVEDLPQPKLDIHFACSDGSDDAALRIALNDLVHTLDLSSVHSLTVARVTQVIPTDLWFTLLRSFSSVIELYLHGSTAIRNITTALGSPLHLLPKLETLMIYEAAFRNNGGLIDSDFTALVTCLKTREANGEKVPKLVVCYSDAKREDMEFLAGCATELVWDGSQQGRKSVPDC